MERILSEEPDVITKPSKEQFNENYSTYKSEKNLQSYKSTNSRVVQYVNYDYQSEIGGRRVHQSISNPVIKNSKNRTNSFNIHSTTSPRRISEKSVTMLQSLNHSGFTNYLPSEELYYRSKQGDVLVTTSKRTSNNNNILTHLKKKKLSSVNESKNETMNKVTSNQYVKFVNLEDFENEKIHTHQTDTRVVTNTLTQPVKLNKVDKPDEVHIYESVVVSKEDHNGQERVVENKMTASQYQRKMYEKRYGTTVVKESNLVTPEQLGLTIRESLIEKSNKKLTLNENEKNLRGSYIKTHYKKLHGKKYEDSERKLNKSQKISERVIKIQDLANISQNEISFDHTGKSTIKVEQVLDKDGNILNKHDEKNKINKILQNYKTNKNYIKTDNTEILKEIKEEINKESAVKTTHQIINKTEQKSEEIEQNDLKSENKAKIVEEFEEAVLNSYLNKDSFQESVKTTQSANYISSEVKEKMVSHLMNEFYQDKEYIRENQEVIMEELSKQIMDQYGQKKILKNSESLIKQQTGKESVISNITFGQNIEYSKKESGDSKIIEIINEITSNTNIETNNIDENHRHDSFAIREQLIDAPIIKFEEEGMDKNNSQRNIEFEDHEEQEIIKQLNQAPEIKFQQDDEEIVQDNEANNQETVTSTTNMVDNQTTVTTNEVNTKEIVTSTTNIVENRTTVTTNIVQSEETIVSTNNTNNVVGNGEVFLTYADDDNAQTNVTEKKEDDQKVSNRNILTKSIHRVAIEEVRESLYNSNVPESKEVIEGNENKEISENVNFQKKNECDQEENYQIETHQLPKKELVESVEMKSVNEPSVTQESVKQESEKEPSIKQESIKEPSVKRESVKEQSIRQESVKKSSVKQESVKQENIKEESVKEKIIQKNIEIYSNQISKNEEKRIITNKEEIKRKSIESDLPQNPIVPEITSVQSLGQTKRIESNLNTSIQSSHPRINYSETVVSKKIISSTKKYSTEQITNTQYTSQEVNKSVSSMLKKQEPEQVQITQDQNKHEEIDIPLRDECEQRRDISQQRHTCIHDQIVKKFPLRVIPDKEFENNEERNTEVKQVDVLENDQNENSDNNSKKIVVDESETIKTEELRNVEENTNTCTYVVEVPQTDQNKNIVIMNDQENSEKQQSHHQEKEETQSIEEKISNKPISYRPNESTSSSTYYRHVVSVPAQQTTSFTQSQKSNQLKTNHISQQTNTNTAKDNIKIAESVIINQPSEQSHQNGNSVVVKEIRECRVVESSVKENNEEVKEISRSTYEKITEGNCKEGQIKANIDSQNTNLVYIREVPKIIEVYVDKPYEVIIEKPVPNYVHKEVITEVHVEKQTKRIIENKVEERIERDIQETIKQKNEITNDSQLNQHSTHSNDNLLTQKASPSKNPTDPQISQTVHSKTTHKTEQIQKEPLKEDLGFNSEDLERMSITEDGETQIRTYYVRKEQPKYVDVEDIEYKVKEKIVEVPKQIEKKQFKDVEVEVVNTVVVEEEEIIVQKKDVVKDVIKDVHEDVIKQVPKTVYRTVQKYKDVPRDIEVVQEVDVEVFVDKEVEVIREVEVPNYIHKEVEIIQDVYEDEEKSEVFQKVIENQREVEVNVTKLKPRYKEVPVEKYTDVEVEVNSYNPVESVQTLNKTKDMYVPRKVEKIIKKPVYVDKKVEKVYEQEIIKEIPIYVEKIVEKKIPVYIDKKVNVPYKKYVEKTVIKQVDKEYEIEVIEETPVFLVDEEENITNVDLKNTRLKQILDEKNREKNTLIETSENLQRELRKSHNRNKEWKSQSKKVYNYVGKEQNQELRNELTNLHKEFKDTIKFTTKKQMNELNNFEVVKTKEMKRMNEDTIQELKKSGVIGRQSDVGVVLEENVRDEQVTEFVESHKQTNFERNDPNILSSSENVTFNNHAFSPKIQSTIQNKLIQNQSQEQKLEQSLQKNYSENQEVEKMTFEGRAETNNNIFPEQAQKRESQNLNESQDNISQISSRSSKRSINLNSYRSKGINEIRLSTTQRNFKKQSSARLVYASVRTPNDNQEENEQMISEETKKAISNLAKENNVQYESVDELAKKMMNMGENNQL